MLRDLQIRHRDRQALREGYSPAVRRFEIASIAAYAVVMGWLAVRLGPRMVAKPFLALSALMLGFVAADFVSGVVHWMADTWGTPDWPIVGKTLIRPFREHHVDPKEITRHDFVETNGNNCFISIPAAALAALLPLRDPLWFFVAAMVFALCLAILGTNQFHKWAHMDAPPRLVRLLQRANLILPPAHHAVHHQAPYARYYCITVGWLNEALFRLRFFQTLEKLITRLTGLVPREDDIGKHAAEVVARQPPPPLPELPKIALPSMDLELELPKTAVAARAKPD
ncbi:MAG TPA: fatty acid desaturase CarF family protein [Myxococcales bacterium]|nr:fatty acid desaturase CarF family protein [Myxococcales bacterium]